MNVVALQWRIQDFPCGGRGAIWYYFCTKWHENEKNGLYPPLHCPGIFSNISHYISLNRLVPLTADKMTIPEKNISNI